MTLTQKLRAIFSSPIAVSERDTGSGLQRRTRVDDSFTYTLARA